MTNQPILNAADMFYTMSEFADLFEKYSNKKHIEEDDRTFKVLPLEKPDVPILPLQLEFDFS